MGERAAGADGHLLGGQLGDGVRGEFERLVAVQQEVFAQRFLLLGVGLAGERLAQGTELGERRHFARGERAGVKEDVLNCAMEGFALAALADAGRGRGLGVRLELVDLRAGLGEDAVDVDLHAGGLAAAVVGHEHMLVGGVDGIARGRDLDGVIGPLADDVDAEVAAGLEEVPALRALRVIHARDDRARAFDLVGLDPGAGGEGLLGAEVTGLAEDEVGAFLEDGSRTGLAVLHPGDRLAGGGRAGGQAFAFVQGEAGDEVLGRDVGVEVGGLGLGEPLFEERRAELTGRGDLLVALGDFAREGVPARPIRIGR